jgi:SAM-dependent methyltransferase
MDRDLANRIAERYAKGSRAVRGYVAGKLRSDPVVSRILELGPLGDVVDIGCGRGQLAVALLEAGVATRVLGFDWDGEKVEVAKRAAEGLNAEFEVGDLRDHPIAPCDTALLVDVLHYLKPEEQEAVLDRAIAAARRAIVRELDPNRGWRSAVTRAQEAITTTLGYNAGERLEYRPISSISGAMARAGMRVTIEPAWGTTPFANVLVIGQRA